MQAVQDSMVAAVDLGSNSFHMVVAKEEHGQLHLLDRLRERVALAEGLSEEKRLDEGVRERALHCLQRFGQRLYPIPSQKVRAVGTSTLRRLKDDGEFLSLAEEALGHPIEVISGAEEARLVYLGVSHNTSPHPGRRLVVDIGGGSTECIIGSAFEPEAAATLRMGCVNFSLKYFPGGKFKRKRFDEAVTGAKLQLRAIKRRFRDLGWERAFGSSGTIRSIAQMLAEHDGSGGLITADGLTWLRDQVLDARSVGNLKLPGMPSDRAPVLAGGLAVLTALFQSLRIESLAAASGALREGVLYDLLGRIHHEDVRDRTIGVFRERYRVDARQAKHVEATALSLLEQTQTAWGIDPERGRQLLSWASWLHEIGLAVSHSGFHKHGAYLVTHSDMPGFSREDQQLVGVLIRGHRRRISNLIFEGLARRRAHLARRLLALFRVAVLLNRSRGASGPPRFRVDVQDSSFALAFAEGWLERHPMTRADLAAEAAALKVLGLELLAL